MLMGLKQSLLKLWQKLEGWKSVIGLILLQIERRVDLPVSWAVDIVLIILYIWTGVGLVDKARRIKNDKKTRDR